MVNGSTCAINHEEGLRRQLFGRRIVWSAALIWTCLVAAVMLGIALGDPALNSPAAFSSLGLIWLAVFAGILLVGRRLCGRPSSAEVSLFDALDVRAGEQAVMFADAAMAMVDRNGRIRTINDHLCRILGRSPGEVLGKPISEFIPPENHESFREQLRRRRRGISGTYELRVVRPDGEIRVLLAAVHPVYDRFGKQVGGLGLLSDITEKKRAETAVREHADYLERVNRELEAARAEAERAIAVRDQFLANVTHELRTPLTAILGYAETLLVEGDISKAPPVRLGAVQTILRNGRYLLRVVNDLLDIARIEAGQLAVEAQSFSPTCLAADVLSLLRVKADAKGLPLLLEARPPLPRLIRSDPFRLRQILINLVGNAIKFTDSGSVRLILKAVTSDEGECRLEFDVIDTGIGIPSDLLERIFEPFYQVDGGAAKRYGGTGLGLAISRNLARRLGGEIHAVSESGFGSNFRLTLPVGKRSELEWETSPTLDLEAAPGSEWEIAREAEAPLRLTARVLLAEDAPDTRRLFVHILQGTGVEVETAENGTQAVRAALQSQRESRPFDCVLMDMQMPEMDGYQAVHVLRESGYNSPIIALTANAEPGDRSRCLQAGCDGFAAKPLSKDALIRLVSRYASGRRGVPRPAVS
ncbi:MAG: response regulator [Thermogutta sp.]|nr:response regulator [Thermogutta sp.]